MADCEVMNINEAAATGYYHLALDKTTICYYYIF